MSPYTMANVYHSKTGLVSAQYGVVRLDIELIAGVSCANMAKAHRSLREGPRLCFFCGRSFNTSLSQNENAYNNVPHECRGHQVFMDSPYSGLPRNLYDLRFNLDPICDEGSRSATCKISVQSWDGWR